jgi:hypothetical protein
MGSTCLTAPRIHLIMANSWSRQWGQPHLHEANYAVYEAEAVEIWRELACSRSGVSLGYYPGNPIIYWFTDSPAGCPLACWGEESGLLVAMNPWLRNARRRVQLRHERPETKPTRGL